MCHLHHSGVSFILRQWKYTQNQDLCYKARTHDTATAPLLILDKVSMKGMKDDYQHINQLHLAADYPDKGTSIARVTTTLRVSDPCCRLNSTQMHKNRYHIHVISLI
jgi:hypothetical protein